MPSSPSTRARPAGSCWLQPRRMGAPGKPKSAAFAASPKGDAPPTSVTLGFCGSDGGKAMALQLLDFDYSEAEDDVATWDAIASVPAARLQELAQEVQSILAWACAEFGALYGPHEEGGL